MKTFSIFLSRVDSEFGDFDAHITHALTGHRPAIKVSSQSAFANRQAGNNTLHKLLNELRHSSVVAHYLGQTLGPPIEKERFIQLLHCEPGLEKWLREEQLDCDSWSYTQWKLI